ncbi:MAG: hypothetical protein A49_06680 [Methyloceanibacter sp.]|nr:MAG: hypothetical protein A49_06680 [Methyloceanibacter sp.]
MARFHRYSFGNVMLITLQRPDATQVAGFRAWRILGRTVKRGEKGIAIIAPMAIRRNDERNPSGEDDDSENAYIRFRAVHVFDVVQTVGEALPEPATASGDPSGHTERLRAHVAELGIELQYTNALGSARGCSEKGRILIRCDLTPAEEFTTLTHELAHELMHSDRRLLPSKRVLETEAEAVASIVAQAIGLNTGTSATDYIQMYDGDKETLAGSLDRIQQTAAHIIASIVVHTP